MPTTSDDSKPASRAVGYPGAPLAVRTLLLAVLIIAAAGLVPAGAHGDTDGGTLIQAPLAERGCVVVGGEPKYLLVDPFRDRLLVSDFTGESVAVIDLTTGLIVRRIPVPGAPAGLALSDSGDILFVACYSGFAVVAVDIDSGRVVARAEGLEHPWDLEMVAGPDGRGVLAVTENGADRVTFLDGEGIDGSRGGEGGEGALTRVGGVSTAYYPYHLDVVAGILYVVSYGGKLGGRVDAVDLVTLARVWKTGTGKGSFDVQVSPEVAVMAVANLSGQSVGLYDLAGKSPRELKLGADPRCVRFRAGGELLVSLQSAGEVRSVDVQQAVVTYSMAVGNRPGPMVWLSGEHTGAPDDVLAVANQGDGTISLLSSGETVAEFDDVPADHLFHDQIRALALRGAVGGYVGSASVGQVWFRPDGELTRAQMAKVLVAALALHTETIDPATIEFADVELGSEAFPFDYVQEATAAGIVSGFAGDPPRFGPYESVTRLQLLRMAVRAAAAAGSPLPAATTPAPFVDLPTDAADAAVVSAAFQAGLISGVPGEDGLLRLMAYAPVTRGQAAKIVFGLLASLHVGDLLQ